VTSRHGSTAGVVLAIVLVASATTAIAAAVVAVKRMPARGTAGPQPASAAIVVGPADSIPAEAQAFRMRGGMTAIPFAARREREAHPRTLATFHYLRAYPGAPPRIPHELTPDEFRTSACKTCHERGGYSRRFAAYAPVTPHPGNGPCLQCHAGDDAVMAVPLTSPDPNRRCHQCHGGGGPPRAADALPDWQRMAWPRLATRAPDGPAPPIPHDLRSRGDCNACHAGPAAVAEIRTTHPDRADCRQCHVAVDPEAASFARPAGATTDVTGGLR
jgi:nitrate reductase (cytochrome), electron transfer subunit